MADLRLLPSPTGPDAAASRPGPVGRRPVLGANARVGVLALVAAALVAAYFLWELPLGSAFLVERRALTLATMAVVAVAIGASTVAFHAVTANRILTPAVMGLDSLYLALQTGAVWTFGAIGLVGIPPVAAFGVELVAMVGFSLLLFAVVLGRAGRDVTLLLLVGLVAGGLFRGVSSLLQRLMSPEEFVLLSDRFFADFTGADPGLLAVTAAIVAAASGWLWTLRRELDVVALGHDVATSLGVRHRRRSLQVLAAVAVLVGAATALVGPTLFFGLLVAHLAYRAVGSDTHAHTLPAAALAGVLALVGGQFVFERVLGLEGSLSMVVEFVGGLLFIALVVGRNRR